MSRLDPARHVFDEDIVLDAGDATLSDARNSTIS